MNAFTLFEYCGDNAIISDITPQRFWNNEKSQEKFPI